jgi:2',3'-cyclic-nucleotide 2'-phosphodiesterase (5'-nucleotidase family)
MTRNRVSLPLAVTAGAFAALMASSALAEPATLTILHFNDLDRMSEDDGRGGVARLAGAVAAAREANQHVLVTNGGDNISPSLLSGFDQGAHMIDLLNQVGVDIAVLGNHEFDFGPEILAERVAEADYPILGTNAIDADGEVVDGTLESWTTEVGDYTIGFFGLTTAGTAEKSSPGTVTFSDPAEVAAEMASALREDGADYVIALTHTDVREDAALLDQGAVDMILSGDDHLLTVYYNGDIALAESASQAEYIMEISITFDTVGEGDEQEVAWSPPVFRTIDSATVEPDPQVAEAVAAYEARLSEELDVEIGTTEAELDTRRAVIRGEETTFGNLVADAMREATGADVALTNGGGIRADRIYEPGSVLTRRDIMSELPFGNKTITVMLTGEEIVAALENGFSAVEDGGGRFPHISGMSVTVDLSAEPGNRVSQVTVGGEPIDLDESYELATNDFLGAGGDGYAMFADAERGIEEMAGRLMAAQVIEYIEERGTIRPEVEGRITFQ